VQLSIIFKFFKNHKINFIPDTKVRFLFTKKTGILPWLYSIGDTIGLFPIVYADRLAYAQSRGTIYFIIIII
jgi:hypothetical protein